MKLNNDEPEDFLPRACKRLLELYRMTGLEPGVLQKIGVKPQWNVIIGSRNNCGLAMNFTGEHAIYGEDEELPELQALRKFLGKSLFDLAEHLVDAPDMHGRALCLAALNALSQPLTDQSALESRGFRVSVGELEHFTRPDDVVTIVGHGGVVRQFIGRCKELHVSDMRPVSTFQTKILDERGVRLGPSDLILHTADENPEVLAASDVVIITACTLVNGTIDEVLRASEGARVIGLYGPSAQLPPEVYFPDGINFVRSFRAVDTKKFEFDMDNDMDMEVALKGNQQTYHVYGFA